MPAGNVFAALRISSGAGSSSPQRLSSSQSIKELIRRILDLTTFFNFQSAFTTLNALFFRAD
jgi:hypothetical protein